MVCYLNNVNHLAIDKYSVYLWWSAFSELVSVVFLFVHVLEIFAFKIEQF